MRCPSFFNVIKRNNEYAVIKINDIIYTVISLKNIYKRV
jgi:hypothetical protein